MCRVSYDGKRLIPAPFVSIEKVYQKAGDSIDYGTLFNITINGTIVAWKGSPMSSGTFWTLGGQPPDEVISPDSRLTTILRKQDAIRNLFSVPGKTLEIQGNDAAAPLKCNPRINSISFPEGAWFQTSQYTVQLETDILYPAKEDVDTLGSGIFVSSVNESWNIETNEDQFTNIDSAKTYRLTHNVSAQGKTFYNENGVIIKPAWEHARNFCIQREGIDLSFTNLPSGIDGPGLPSYYNGFNHIRAEQIDKLGGSCTLTETWILSSGAAIESFDIAITSGVTDGITRVNINGNIVGFESNNSDMQVTTTKFTNAENKWNTVKGQLLQRAQNFSGLVLNIIPQNVTIGKNPLTGNINYGYEFNNNPSPCISGAKSEIIIVNDMGQSDVFAAIPVLGRAKGPVLQDIGTSDATTRSLSIEAIFGPSFDCNDIVGSFINEHPRLGSASNAAASINSIIDSINPANQGASQVFRSAPQESWEPRTGRYSLSLSWTYEI